jgi:hypothetical protein
MESFLRAILFETLERPVIIPITMAIIIEINEI